MISTIKRLAFFWLLLLGIPAFADNIVLNQIQTRPFLLVDSTTGLPKTGVTITSITGTIVKSRGLGGAVSTTKTTFTCTASGGGGNECAEIGNGLYDVRLLAANCDTLRDMSVTIIGTGTLPRTRQFYVVASASDQVNAQGNISDPATIAAAVNTNLTATYGTNWTNSDVPISTIQSLLPAALVGGKMNSAVLGDIGGNVVGNVNGSLLGNVNGNVTGSVGSLAAQAKIDAVFHRGILTGTAQSGSATTIQLAAGAGATNNQYAWWLVALTGGTGAGQTALIQSYVGATKTATTFCQATTTGAWLINPDATTTYSLIPAKR